MAKKPSKKRKLAANKPSSKSPVKPMTTSNAGALSQLKPLKK